MSGLRHDDGAVKAKPQKTDDLSSFIYKLIPAEIVSLYSGAYSYLEAKANLAWKEPVLYLVFFICLVLAPIHIWKSQKTVKSIGFALYSTLVFTAWALTIGTAFSHLIPEAQDLGAILSFVFSALIPMVLKPMLDR